MRRPALVLTIVLLAAGCLGDASRPDAGIDAASADEDAAATRPWPAGDNARGYIASYVMTHPFRVESAAFQPYMDVARTDLVALLEGMGLQVWQQAYDGGLNIVAINDGTTNPEQWVVLSAHYDTVGAGVGPTMYGAWDDGAGTATLLELAATVGRWDLPFTVAFAFFDGEEKGLLGSKAFVADVIGLEGVDIVANLNTDPPGLNWPCGDPAGPFPVKIIEEEDRVSAGDPRYAWLSAAVAQGLVGAGVPPEVQDHTAGIPIVTAGGLGLKGTSDHASFGEAGIANVFIGGIPATIVGGDPNSNTAAALTYPLHTPLDTLQAMDARCVLGSLAEGLQTTVDIFAHALVHMETTGVPKG